MVGTKGAKRTVEREVLAALRAADRPLATSEVVALTGRSRMTVKLWLDAGRFDGTIVRTGEGISGNPHRYRLARPDQG
jgi:hypothetical protein